MTDPSDPTLWAHVKDWVGLALAPMALGYEWLRRRLERVEARMHEHEIENARTYMTKAEIQGAIRLAIEPLREDIGDLKRGTERIFEQLQRLDRHLGS